MIRPAQPEDATDLAKLIVLAMGDLATQFTNGTTKEEAIKLFELFAAQPGNQYSYQNTLLYEDETGACGMICAYDGGKLDLLREPFIKHIRKVYDFKGNPENETQAGELYIDCLSVYPGQQGKGIGKKLIAAMFEKAKTMEHRTIGLLVNKENPKAERLYKALDFNIVGETKLLDTVNYHMQRVF